MSVVANVAINVDATKAVQQLKAVDAASKGIKGGLDTAAGGAKGLGGALTAALGPLVSIAAAVEGFRRATEAAFGRAQAETRLKALSSAYGENAQTAAMAASATQKFGLTQTEATTAIADIYGRLRPLGFGLKEVNGVYEGFNVLSKQAALSSAEAGSVFTQLSQALGSGVLRGDEFNRMAESMPSILGVVASELGVAQNELRGMAADGKISAEVVVKALQKVAASGGDLEKFLDPSAKAFNTLKQATEEVFVQLGKLFGPVVIAGMNVLSMIVKKLAEYWEYVGAVLLPKVVKALNPIIEAVKKVTAGIKLETIIEMIQGGLIIAIKAITVAIKLLSPVVVFLIERFAKLAQNPVFKFIAEQVGRLVTHLGKAREGIDQFKAGQDAATASGMNLVKQSSQLPPKIENAKENTKQLKKAQDAVTKAISESSEAIDKTAAMNQAIADQRSSSAAAYLQAEMQVNDVLLDQLNRQLDGAKTRQDRLKIAGDIYKLTVTQAKLEFEASKIQISAAVEKAHLALQATELKAKEVQLAVELATAEGKVNDSHRKSLALAGDAEKLASTQLGTAKLIAEQQMRGANALLQGKIQAAGAAFESYILAQNTNSAASAAKRLATGFQQAADAASSMSDNTTTKAIYGATTTTKTLPAGAIVTDKFGRSQTVGGSAAPRTEHIVPQSKEAGFATVSGSSAIPSGGGGGGGGSPTISIQTGPVMQMNGQNYVTTQDLSSAVQAGVQQTLNMMRNDRGTRRAVGLA